MESFMAQQSQQIQQASALSEFRHTTVGVRHTKIVGTLGPSSSNEDTLRELIRAGLNVARLNFSHGDHETHRKTLISSGASPAKKDVR